MMEIVVFVCFLTVPFISVAALIMALLMNKRLKALKQLVIELTRLAQPQQMPQQQIANEYLIGQM